MEQEHQSFKSIFYHYLEIVRRRLRSLVPFPFLAILAVYYAMSLPSIYQSEGVLLVEDQNIPTELVRTTVTSYAAEQMQVIRQQIESTENVVRIIEDFGLYPDAVDVDRRILAQRFRDRMLVETIDATTTDPTAGRRRIVSIAFRISFQDESPQLATDVAAELVQLFLETNTSTRTREATQTSAFLRGEADELRARVTELEDRMAIFKSEYSDSLPEVLEYNLGVITSSEERLRAIQIEIENLAEQEQLLAIELRSMDPYTGQPIGAPSAGGAGDNIGITPSALLSQKRVELTQLLNRYSDSHPSVQSLRREIAALESQVSLDYVSGGAQGFAEDDLLSPIYLELRYRVGAVERDVTSLRSESAELMSKIADYRNRVENTYIVEREYDELQREYIAASERYDQLRNAQYEAEVAQSLEEKNQVESLNVIEEPSVPIFPVGPDRFKLIVMGVGLAGILCLGLMAVAEFLDERIFGERSIRNLTGQDALVVVPKIRTEKDLARRFSIKRRLVFSALVFGALFALLCVHFLVVDLTTLISN